MSSSSIYGTAASPVTISGLGSGLDTSGIITALTTNENNAISTYQAQQTQLNTDVSDWQTFNTDLLGLQSIAGSLSSPSAFNTTTASIDDTSVASVTATTGATAGTHTLTVSSLAQQQSVLGTGVSDSSVPLNMTGSFMLNGTKISVTPSETLTQIATAISSSTAGVNATVISAGTGDYQLNLTSASTGAINAISASDVGNGTVLESLGLIPTSGATTAIRQTVTTGSGDTGAGSIALASSTEDVGAAMGITDGTAASGTIQISGKSVSVNLNTMSLTDVANAINSAGISGVQAQIVSIPDANGDITATSQKQLQIVSTTSGTPLTASSFTDSGNVLASLGITQAGFTDQQTAAQDASFTVDGINYTRTSNTVNDVITGVSMDLLSTTASADSSTTGTTGTTSTGTPATITLSADTSSVSTTINNFVTAYNGVVDYINQQNTFTPDSTNAEGTAQSSPDLFGNYALTSIQNQLSSMLDVTSGGKSLADVGITINSSGEMAVNSSTLDSALADDPSTVASLFGVSGTATGSGLSFVTAGTSSITSSAAGYGVDITQAATQATVTGTTAYTAPSSAETLTFSGGLFASSAVNLTIPAGTTLSGAISLINGNSNLSQNLYATQNSSGELVITSKGYGSSQLFGVTSNLNAGAGSGIGTGELSGVGKDVAGTINGEPATGDGQSLIGNATNANTAGVQLTYTGSATGNIGSVTVSHGVADELNSLVSTVTNSTTGIIATQVDALNSQVASVQTQITSMQTDVSTYETQLETTFANMEEAVSNLKSQQQAFDAQAGITSSSSTGSSGTSSASSSSS